MLQANKNLRVGLEDIGRQHAGTLKKLGILDDKFRAFMKT